MMTAREIYCLNELAEKYNQLYLESTMVRTERDTLFQENAELRDELERAYHDLSEARGEPPFNPAYAAIKEILDKAEGVSTFDTVSAPVEKQ